MAAVGWRGVRMLAQQIPGVNILRAGLIVEMPTGGWVQVRSADDPQSLRGEGLDLAVFDECGFTREEAWGEAIRPALSDRQGGALFISTPKGHNWFWRLWANAMAGADGWAAWQFPTIDNPFIAPSEIEDAREHLPDRIFRQEYLAEFIDDAGGVFRGVMAAATATPLDEGVRGFRYTMGVDWGKYNDFTVLTVIDAQDRELVAFDRFREIDYQFQLKRLREMVARFSPDMIVVERNAMGEPLVEQLQRQNLPIQPFTTTNQSKTEAIEALSLAIERGDLKLLNEPELISELQGFEAQRLPSGMLRYGAPEGMHDDCVISLALAWHGIVGIPRYGPPKVARYA